MSDNHLRYIDDSDKENAEADVYSQSILFYASSFEP